MSSTSNKWRIVAHTCGKLLTPSVQHRELFPVLYHREVRQHWLINVVIKIIINSYSSLVHAGGSVDIDTWVKRLKSVSPSLSLPGLKGIDIPYVIARRFEYAEAWFNFAVWSYYTNILINKVKNKCLFLLWFLCRNASGFFNRKAKAYTRWVPMQFKV